MPSAATTLGTPRAESWDNPWLDFVAETELRLGRRICGAHAPDGEPCELGSTHPNGRCRFHGGHPRIGGQPGNTNALIHGLYSRRLRQCNNTCPVWNICPFAGPDVTALSERKRPICAYERQAYAIAMGVPEMRWIAAAHTRGAGIPARGVSALDCGADDPSEVSGENSPFDPPLDSPLRNLPFALSDPGESTREGIINQLRFRNTPFFGRRGATTKFPRDQHNTNDAGTSPSDPSVPFFPSFPSDPDPDPAPGMIDDTAAILYAMLQRATLTLSAHELTDKTEAESQRYTFRTTKMSAALSAFLHIGRELRAWMRLRPATTAAAPTAESNFADGQERPEYTADGYKVFYDHNGTQMSLPALMHPFLHELDAAVEQLKKEGIKIPPPDKIKS
jgi:hypothetical protein